MKYKSTRDSQARVSSAQAILQGISAEGGLFVPEQLPALELDDLDCLSEKPYTERAIELLSLFLTDFSDEQLVSCVESAYTPEKFGGSFRIAPLVRLSDRVHMLELWHGPTCAFKDMALQLLPHLMTASSKIVKNQRETVILVATSGDTGKAALEGFRDVPGTRIAVFYPGEGVSPMQKRQMITQEGKNVAVCAIEGNFDDAQTAVKSIFTDPDLALRMEKAGLRFSSANSINWGRLVPQIVYYVSAYCDLLAGGSIRLGEKVNVCVPTGNFGNILAAYYAKKMGVPFGRLICASNRNKVLTDFIRTGVYDKNRAFYTTISPSMDILISSNLERLLYDLSGEDDSAVSSWYAQLAENGRYQVSDEVKARIGEHFYGGFCEDEEAKAAIQDTFRQYGRLCDPHTGVAVKVYQEYRAATGDQTSAIIVSTASPYKFAGSVLSALGEPVPAKDAAQLEALQKCSGMAIPRPLSALEEKPVRFAGSVPKDAIKAEVLRLLGLS